MTRVKLCGMTRSTDIEAAAAAGADAIGVICEVPVDTPRSVDRATATELLDAVPPFLSRVLVIMPETASEAIEYYCHVEPDAIQIHGLTDRAELAAIATAIDGGLFVAIDADELDTIPAIADLVDGVFVDSLTEDGAGGSGETHDWDRTRSSIADLDVPVVLAGGLTPENVAEAIETVDPYGVDVASGVERDGGIKDHDALARFVENARNSPAPGGVAHD